MSAVPAQALVPFHFTDKQEEARTILAGDATHVMIFGGSRSGKTFLFVRSVVARALKAPGSRHLICRFRFNHLKASIILDTFPQVMRLCFPQVKYNLSKSDWYVTLPNASEIWFAGLDDKGNAVAYDHLGRAEWLLLHGADPDGAERIVGTAALGIYLVAEPATALRLICIALILSGIVGLKLVT